MSKYINPWPQYLDENGNPYAGGTVFFGEPNQDPISNPKAPFSDESLQVPIGASQVLDDRGMFQTAIFLSGFYSASLFDIENNFIRTDPNFSGYLTIEEIEAALGEGFEAVKSFPTLTAAVTDVSLVDGDALNLAERTTGNGGGAMWDVVLSSTVTENTFDIVQGTGVATLSLVLRKDFIDVVQFGAARDGSTDDTIVIQRAIDYSEGLGSFKRKDVNFPVGNYAVTELIVRTEVSLIGEDMRNTRLTGIGDAGTAIMKAAGDGFLGGATQKISGFSFIPPISEVNTINGIDLSAASNTNGIYFHDLWFNNVDVGITLDTFGDIWMKGIVVELSDQCFDIANGDDIHMIDILSFKNNDRGIDLNNVKSSNLSTIRMVDTGGVTSTDISLLLTDCVDININNLIIRSTGTADRPPSRMIQVSGCTNLEVTNFNLEGFKGDEGDTELGIKIQGVCDNVNFSHGTVKNVITPDTGIGVTVGDGVNAITRCTLTSVNTNNTGGAGIKQNDNAELELIACETVDPMVGSVAAIRPGWDLRSTARTKVVGGRVSGSNITAGHGVHCSSVNDKKLIGVTANDGITAVGDTRVFVDGCDTGGNGFLAQTTTATINPGLIASGAEFSTTVALVGVKTQDAILWGPGTATLGQLQVTVRPGGNDVIDIEIHNPTGGGITPSSASWTFKLVKMS